MLTPEQLRSRLIDSKLASAETLQGCTASELDEIELTLNRVLPNVYKDVMSILGHRAGQFMSDIDFVFPQLLLLRERAEAAMKQYNSALPENTFVFATRYGEQFFFFYLDNNQDPAVFRWYDDAPEKFTRVSNSFSEFIEAQLVEQESTMQD
ncbi:MAG: SMI1/KNR4 family protein [Pirellulaceae bacterium]